MDLKKKIDDFRQLQIQRRLQRNNRTKIKMTDFTALVKAEEGLPTYQANITVTVGVCISIIEQHPTNCHPRRNVLFISDYVETYDSDGNTIEINFIEDFQIPDVQIMFSNVGERQEFEVAFRTFMGYSNPEDINMS